MAEYLDTDLLNDFNHGRKKAFDELYDRYYSMIFCFCFNLTGQRDESQDITLEALNILFLKYQDFESLQNIKAFLYITARNRCFDYFRQMKRMADAKNRLIATLTGEDEVNDSLDAEYLHVIKKSIDGLPRRQREVIELLYLTEQKYKYKEVADQMNISIKAVEKLRQKGLTYLREVLHAKSVMSTTLRSLFLSLFL